MTDKIVLRLEGVEKSYHSAGGRSVPVLDGVSLTVHKGETLVLLGKSGTGKTTLARCILRLEAIQAGTIQSAWGAVAGASGLLSRRELYSRIQLVPQATSQSLNPFRTLRRTLVPILSSISGARNLDEILALCGLDASFLDRRPGQLSGGQSQRVLLARALAMNPELIIFDEPVSSLDLSIQARILNTLLRLKEQCGLSYLFITHDLDIAEYVSDRSAVIERGRIIIREDLYGNRQ